MRLVARVLGFPQFKKPLGASLVAPCRSHRPLPTGRDLCDQVEEAAHGTRSQVMDTLLAEVIEMSTVVTALAFRFTLTNLLALITPQLPSCCKFQYDGVEHTCTWMISGVVVSQPKDFNLRKPQSFWNSLQ
ncbi:hypothetical protein OPV22_015109 [Ensete ventricosum]|uniref:Uncharacterized protein n=1 Tax=Ensete ventricosum TaxID=4639 RepID=A0AAV8PLF0_ENSVE|nr:hypothetical protein OPV22_015109 [Ensete ventricosum]